MRSRFPSFALLAVLLGSVPILADPVAVRGRVLVPGGAPLADAEVRLLPLETPLDRLRAVLGAESAEPAARGRTDADGRFHVDAPGAGLWLVRVDAPGFAPVGAELRPLIEPVELPEVELDADAGIQARVVDDKGAPLAGATVLAETARTTPWASRAVWGPPARHGTTGADGTIRLPRGETERITLSAAAAGRVPVELRAVSGTAATLRLKAGRGLPLEVRAADGAVVPDVLVTVGRRPHPVGVTDAAGRITVHLDPAVPAPASVISTDGRRVGTRLAAPPPDAKQARRTIRLPERLAIPGRLIDESTRQPIAGGLVWDATNPVEGTTTDASGGFALRGNAEARMELTAGAPGYVRADPREFQLRDDGRAGPTLALRPAAAVEGRVVDGDGEPIAGAEVSVAVKRAPGGMRIEIGRPAELPRARTDRKGAFRVAPLDAEQSYQLSVRAEGYAPGGQVLSGLEPYRTRDGLRIALERGRRVVGRIVGPDGTAVREARVDLLPARGSGGAGMLRIIEPGESTALAGAASDSEGSFAIAGIAEGHYDLEISRHGYAKRRLPGVEVGASQQAVDVGEIALEPGERIQGVVVGPGGTPVEGAEISVAESGGGMGFMLGGLGSQEPEPDAVSDPTGWFAVEDLAVGRSYTLSFRRAGYVERTVKAVEPPRVEPLEVTLQPASDVSGRVLDAAGEPIVGAQVSLTRSRTIEIGGAVMQTVMMQNAEADAEGRYLFEDQEPGTISLAAVASGYREAQRDNVEVSEGRDLEGADLTLEAGAFVEGRVLAPDGRPVIGARVDLVTEENRMPGLGGVRTDGDGTYRLEGLEPGTVSIEALHDDHPRAVRTVEVREGPNSLNIQLEGGHEVRGLVVDENGAPVADAALRLNSPGRMWGGPETSSRGDGSFVLPGVQDGEYEFWADAEGFAGSAREPRVTVDGGPVDGVVVRLERGGSIVGSVSGIEPGELPRLTVRAEGEGTFGYGGASVDRDGGYRIEHLRPGSYTVVARIEGSGRQTRGNARIEPGAAEVRLDLEFGDGLRLAGRVIQGDAVVAGATIFVEGLDVAHEAWGETGSDGGFALEGLEPGRYRLAVRNWATGLAHDETLDLAASREIEVEIPTASIRGTIRDAADRRPLAGVSVVLESTAPELMGRIPVHTATSDVDGAFTLGSLADGEWRLQATRKGYAAVSRAVAVQHGRGDDDLAIEMSPTEGLTLEARLPSGGVPDELRIAVLDPAGAALVAGTFATGENGRVHLSQVPAGGWEVLISAAGAATASVAAAAPGAPVAVALEPPTHLSVVVPELSGSSALATVRVAGATGKPFQSLGWNGRPQADFRMSGGKIEFASLPPGSWTVAVTASEGRTWQGQTRTSPGAPSELILE